MAVDIASMQPAQQQQPQPSTATNQQQTTVTPCAIIDKDRLPKLKELLKTHLHTYQLQKIIGEGGYGTVFESVTNDGLVIEKFLDFSKKKIKIFFFCS